MNGNKGKLNIIKKRFFELEGTEIETFQIETQRGKKTKNKKLTEPQGAVGKCQVANYEWKWSFQRTVEKEEDKEKYLKK